MFFFLFFFFFTLWQKDSYRISIEGEEKLSEEGHTQRHNIAARIGCMCAKLLIEQVIRFSSS